jgi:predicted nucleotide-binding protein
VAGRSARLAPALAYGPPPVLARISSRSNSAKPPRTVSISLPCGVVVSAQASLSDLKPTPRFAIARRATGGKRVSQALLGGIVATWRWRYRVRDGGRAVSGGQQMGLTLDQIQQGITRLERCIERIEKWDPWINDIDTVKSDASRWEAAVDAALTQTFGAGTPEFRRYSGAKEFHYPLSMARPVPHEVVRESLFKCRTSSLKLLHEVVTFLKQEQELANATPVSARPEPSRKPSNIVIGHGRSPEWLKLKDFLKDRLGLPVDEFNSVSVAGVSTVARLSAMLDDAAMAFLVMTAEDEQLDGKMRARENVVHEAGLFQGRLGFKRAIVLLEDGCEEFSNIHGLGQLRFPNGHIEAQFEEVRRALEREKLIG